MAKMWMLELGYQTYAVPLEAGSALTGLLSQMVPIKRATYRDPFRVDPASEGQVQLTMVEVLPAEPVPATPEQVAAILAEHLGTDQEAVAAHLATARDIF